MLENLPVRNPLIEINRIVDHWSRLIIQEASISVVCVFVIASYIAMLNNLRITKPFVLHVASRITYTKWFVNQNLLELELWWQSHSLFVLNSYCGTEELYLCHKIAMLLWLIKTSLKRTSMLYKTIAHTQYTHGAHQFYGSVFFFPQLVAIQWTVWFGVHCRRFNIFLYIWFCLCEIHFKSQTHIRTYTNSLVLLIDKCKFLATHANFLANTKQNNTPSNHIHG